ncbi:MAG: IS3 family transposase [Planctomycetia bacterium]
MHGQSRNRYGYRRFHASLVRKGLLVGRNAVQCIRSHAGIRSCNVKTKAKLNPFVFGIKQSSCQA